MEKNTLGIIIFFVGLIALIQSFNLTSTNQIVYLGIGIALIIGGLWYAREKK